MSAPLLHNYDLDEDCYRARLVAACSGVALDLRNVDMFPGAEHRSDAYLRLNPLGTLPILQDEMLVLTQPEAILRRIAALDPERRLMPEDSIIAARIDDWLAFWAQHLAPAKAAREIALMATPGDLAALSARTARMLRVMEDHMTHQTIRGLGFFAGPELTLADLALFPAFALSRDHGLDHDAFPALRLWARRVRLTPGFITMPGIPDYH
ncbi:glutathione S-transferase family protein [Paenirhodobacter hankyongi]|uniref:Glutathione S-transferase family protein n=1 Tax=Paenirhodobacter hankyongi TaxID=2294033 RepID=A0A421BPT6_9RHOB|nr:glutathione S-transferase family protein [Sinirhodobacter hankyongi]RLL65060.1 glutathione S-transferase family protein [Sinirhodobacter hankyongi]